MRSCRALRLSLQSVSRPSRRRVAYRHYCSSCETPVLDTTSKPPILAADHRQLAIEQELFTTSIYSPGSPLFLPNGARIFNKLAGFLRAQYAQFGFQEVITPTIYKKSLWEKSGHWENYADDMFAVSGRKAPETKEDQQVGEEEDYGLKPMNCPGHCLLFASKARSFRDLPIRYADFSPLHRNEISGALSGLTRVRRFHQDDGHIFCRPSQIGEEISRTLQFVKLTYETFNLGPYKLALSTRPADHFIGTKEDWDRAEEALRKTLDESGQEWTINEGDGAFYGPKIDIILNDSDGKSHQTATIQLDFQLPKRFNLEYTAPAPELEQKGLTTTDPKELAVSGPVTPVIIHRAVLGSVERFFALLIEHYNGKWPFWLAPRQIMVITVNNEDPQLMEYAYDVVDYLRTGTHTPSPVSGLNSPSFARKPNLNPGHLLPDWVRLALLSSSKSVFRDGDFPSARPAHLATLAVDLDTSARSVRKKVREAKEKRYAVVVVVGKQNLAAEGQEPTLTVDLSGLPALKDGVPEGVDARNVEMAPTVLRRVLSHMDQTYQ